jgi:hypothetical protein
MSKYAVVRNAKKAVVEKCQNRLLLKNAILLS